MRLRSAPCRSRDGQVERGLRVPRVHPQSLREFSWAPWKSPHWWRNKPYSFWTSAKPGWSRKRAAKTASGYEIAPETSLRVNSADPSLSTARDAPSYDLGSYHDRRAAFGNPIFGNPGSHELSIVLARIVDLIQRLCTSIAITSASGTNLLWGTCGPVLPSQRHARPLLAASVNLAT